ncbi:MAG: type 1 glutamine amidotransferase [Phycisphaerae bacterium]
MPHALVLRNSPAMGPGRIVPVFQDFGIPLQVRNLYAGDDVPTDLDEVRVLILLGGTKMSVVGEPGEAKPFINQLLAATRVMAEADRPVLGIGFGAQVLAAACGAKVTDNQRPGKTPDDAPTLTGPEVGFAGIKLPFPGGTEPIVQGLMDNAPFFHWHAQSFDLPKLPPPPGHDPTKPGPPPPTGNALMASTAHTRNQAFRFKNRLFGFQFHFELSDADINAVIADDSDPLVRHLGPDGKQAVRDGLAAHYGRYNRLGTRILKNFVQYLKAY